MQPTEQVILPYTLARQVFSEGVTDVPLPAAYDFLLTDINLAVNSGVQGSLLIALVSTIYVISVPAVGSSVPTVVEGPSWQGMLLCPAGGTLYVESAGASLLASISGWLLNPPASQILPT